MGKSFEDLLSKKFFQLFLCLCLIVVTFNSLNNHNSFYRAEISTYLKDFFSVKFNSFKNENIHIYVEILAELNKNLFGSLRPSVNYLIIGKPFITFKVRSTNRTINKRYLFPFTTNNKVEHQLRPHWFEDEFINASICNGSFTYTKFTQNLFDKFLKNHQCLDRADEFVGDCSGFQAILDEDKLNEHKRKCLRQNYKLKSLKFELNLYNSIVKHLIYVKFYIVSVRSSGNVYRLSVDVIDLDHALFKFRSSLGNLLLIIALILIYFVKIAQLWSKRMWKIVNIVNFLMVVVMTRIFVNEWLFHLELVDNLKGLFDNREGHVSLSQLAAYSNMRDLLVGYLYALVFLKSLSYISLNEFINNILITFRRCYLDLVGFFIILISLLVCYSLELNFLYGGEFKQYSTFKKCFLVLFKLVWGDVNFDEIVAYDWKAFYILFSCVILIVVVLFNLMLAIILGTYDRVKLDPVCRYSYLKISESFYGLIERCLKRFHVSKAILKMFNLSNVNRRYCVQDVERNFIRNGFSAERVEKILLARKLIRNEQVDKQEVQALIEAMFELEFEEKPRLKLVDKDLADSYVNSAQWKKLVLKYQRLENFCSSFEKRIDLLNDLSQGKS